MALSANIKTALGRLSPKQRQYAMLGAIMGVGVGALWAVFALTDNRAKTAPGQMAGAGLPATVSNIGVMTPGQQVNPVDQWVGNAGKKLAQYDADKQEQAKLNAERKTFEDTILKRFAEFEQKQTAAALSQIGSGNGTSGIAGAAQYPPAAAVTAQELPPPPPLRNGPVAGMPAGTPGSLPPQPDMPSLVRVSLGTGTKVNSASPAAPPSAGPSGKDSDTRSSIDVYLPVSFTRGILLGGLDAPTGGQSQSNPHPVLIRLVDNAVLPNRFRSDVRECFVIAAGYGDISSERAYLRTENLSCVRGDGSTLDVKIQGSVYGEDGKVGLRGRLVSKQGQMLANALRAGIVGGIGQGFSQSGASVSSSTFGTIATTSGNTREQFEHGMGGGVGRALDRLAQYYIKLAEQTFPIIEIDAGRQIDVVITKGVRIEAGAAKTTPPSAAGRDGSGDDYSVRTANNEEEY